MNHRNEAPTISPLPPQSGESIELSKGVFALSKPGVGLNVALNAAPTAEGLLPTYFLPSRVLQLHSFPLHFSDHTWP